MKQVVMVPSKPPKGVVKYEDGITVNESMVAHYESLGFKVKDEDKKPKKKQEAK